MADEKKIVKKSKKERKLHPLRYLKEMWGEVKKLSWLSIPDLAKHTVAVIVFVLLMSMLVYGFDQAFAAGVQGLSKIAPSQTAEPLEHDHDGDGVDDHEAEDHVDEDTDEDLSHDHDGDGVNDHEAEEHEDAEEAEATAEPEASDDSEEADGETEETPAP